jgi:hypothetical protein
MNRREEEEEEEEEEKLDLKMPPHQGSDKIKSSNYKRSLLCCSYTWNP